MKKRYLWLLLLLIIPMFKVEARTLQDMYDDLASREAAYAKVKSGKSMTQNQINQAQAEIREINSTISQTESEIAAAEQTIKDSEAEIEAKKQETNELMKFFQLSQGENVYLEYLFEADSYTDFIYRYSIIKQLSDYNNKLMEELDALVKEMEETKVELKKKKESLTAQKQELTNKTSSLYVSLASYDEEGSTIEEDIRDFKKEIKYYESLGCNRNQDVTTCSITPNASGWSYPLSKGTVSDNYTGYAYQRPNIGGYHHGIDLWYSGISGAPINPVASGTIARIGWISGGGNAIYIYHTVNGKPYTSVYMHMSSFAAGMYQGKVVTTSTVIGYVGNTGVSFGAHLHLGLANGHHATNFNSYSFDPRNVLSFPAMDSGVYFYR